MAKKPSGKQMEMLLPIVGRREAIKLVEPKAPRSLSYEKVVESLRSKGLTKIAGKK